MTTATTPRRTHDPLLDRDAALRARLDGLAARRAAAGPSAAPPRAPRSALPPPSAAGSQAGPPPPSGRNTGGSRPRRRHPAQHSRSAALALSIVTTGGLGYLFAATDHSGSVASAAPVGIVPTAATSTAAAATTADPATPAAAPTPAVAESIAVAETPATTTASVAADPIVVNGQSFSNKFGDVQVQATFASDGSIVAVDAVQVPFRDGKSVRINDRAVPVLNSEALTAQSAAIHTVSGATYTSMGYQQSLQSAIDVAIANGITTAAAVSG